MLNKNGEFSRWNCSPSTISTRGIQHLPSQDFTMLYRDSPCFTRGSAQERGTLRLQVGPAVSCLKKGPAVSGAPKEDDKATKSYNIHFHRFPPWFLRQILLDPPTHTSSGTTGILGEGTCWEHSTVSSDCSQHRGSSWTTKLGGAVAPPWHGFTSRSFRLRIPYQTAMPIECLSLYLQMIKATYNQSVLIILNPGKFHYICTIHVEIVHVYTMCIYIYILACATYVPSIS